MTKAIRYRNGSDIVRRDHLARLKAGAAGIVHLVKTDDGAAAERSELTNEVVEIGRQNRVTAGYATGHDPHEIKKTLGSGAKST